MNLPAAEEEGSVIVEVHGKSDKTGKSSDLGQTNIDYFDERRKALKQIVQDREQFSSLFETWKTDCKRHSTDSREKETKSSSSSKHERPLDIFHQYQVNVEFVVKARRGLTQRTIRIRIVCWVLWRDACGCKRVSFKIYLLLNDFEVRTITEVRDRSFPLRFTLKKCKMVSVFT